jgi:hypothetical protein
MAISDLSFRVMYDLTGPPTLVLTDTTASTPAGLVGIFAITQPDGYTRTGNISSPDITFAGGSFSFPLTLDSIGGVQCGTYTIVYTATTNILEPSTDFTRTYVFDYTAPTLVLTEDFDVFSPLLRYVDNTSYPRASYTNGPVTRSWTAVSTPTGTITGSTQTFTISYLGQYYDANYTIGLTSTLTYTHFTYPWLTVQEIVTKSVSTFAQTPPTPTQITQGITELKALLDNAENTCIEYGQLKADFEYSQTLFQHILDKVRVGDMSGIYTDLKDLVAVLNGNQIPLYVPTNLPILPYNISSFVPEAAWGSITGVITLQTDLINYISSQFASRSFSAAVGSGAVINDVTHNLNSLFVEVEVYETSTGDTVYADVRRLSANAVRITFSSLAASNNYRVIIMK